MALDQELIRLAQTNPSGVQSALASRRPQFAQFKGSGQSRISTPQASLPTPSLVSAPAGGKGFLAQLGQQALGSLISGAVEGGKEWAINEYIDANYPAYQLPAASDTSPQYHSEVPPPVEEQPSGQNSDVPTNASASAQNIYAYAVQRGLGHNHAMAMVANAAGESSFNPDVSGDNGAAYGLFQWNGPRKRDLLAQYGGKPTWQQQVDYIVDGLEPESKKFLNQDFASAEEATEWFTRYWERPKHVDADVKKRVAMLPKFEKEIDTRTASTHPAQGDMPTQSSAYDLPAQDQTEIDRQIAEIKDGRGKLNFHHEWQRKGMRPEVLQALEDTGLDLKITSGHRPQDYNAKIGGAKESRHIHGDAADISVAGMSEDERAALVNKLKRAGFKTLITYEGSDSIHVDMHARGGRPWTLMHSPTGKGSDASYTHMSKSPSWALAGSKGPVNVGDWKHYATASAEGTPGEAVNPEPLPGEIMPDGSRWTAVDDNANRDAAKVEDQVQKEAPRVAVVNPPAVPTDDDLGLDFGPNNQQPQRQSPQENRSAWQQLFQTPTSGYMMTPGAGEAQAYTRQPGQPPQLASVPPQAPQRSPGGQATPHPQNAPQGLSGPQGQDFSILDYMLGVPGRVQQRDAAIARQGQQDLQTQLALSQEGRAQRGEAREQGRYELQMGQAGLELEQNARLRKARAQAASQYPQQAEAIMAGAMDKDLPGMVGQGQGYESASDRMARETHALETAGTMEDRAIKLAQAQAQEQIASTLDSQGNSAQAALVRSGKATAEQMAEFMGATGNRVQTVKVDGKDVSVQMQPDGTYKPVSIEGYQPTPVRPTSEDISRESQQFLSAEPMQKYYSATRAFDSLRDALSKDSKIASQAAIVQFIKALDPGSVVSTNEAKGIEAETVPALSMLVSNTQKVWSTSGGKFDAQAKQAIIEAAHSAAAAAANTAQDYYTTRKDMRSETASRLYGADYADQYIRETMGAEPKDIGVPEYRPGKLPLYHDSTGKKGQLPAGSVRVGQDPQDPSIELWMAPGTNEPIAAVPYVPPKKDDPSTASKGWDINWNSFNNFFGFTPGR